jgi:hypothetical protein
MHNHSVRITNLSHITKEHIPLGGFKTKIGMNADRSASNDNRLNVNLCLEKSQTATKARVDCEVL